MITCCVKYVIDPYKLKEFERYARNSLTSSYLEYVDSLASPQQWRPR